VKPPASSTRRRSPARALQNAASIAGLLLTTECLISDVPEKKEAGGDHGHDHGMGGMM
jgi:chaperonin GroEL